MDNRLHSSKIKKIIRATFGIDSGLVKVKYKKVSYYSDDNMGGSDLVQDTNVYITINKLAPVHLIEKYLKRYYKVNHKIIADFTVVFDDHLINAINNVFKEDKYKIYLIYNLNDICYLLYTNGVFKDQRLKLEDYKRLWAQLKRYNLAVWNYR